MAKETINLEVFFYAFGFHYGVMDVPADIFKCDELARRRYVSNRIIASLRARPGKKINWIGDKYPYKSGPSIFEIAIITCKIIK